MSKEHPGIFWFEKLVKKVKFNQKTNSSLQIKPKSIFHANPFSVSNIPVKWQTHPTSGKIKEL